MSRGSNLRKAREAGYRARYDSRSRSSNPFSNGGQAWASLRGAWFDGWDTANKELGA